MSLHDPLSPPAVNPGGATVADIRAMSGSEALCVMMLRDWFDGPEGRARVCDTFHETLGQARGAGAAEAWAELGHLVTNQTRRPVMRHAISCRCVGADEAVIALVLMLAAQGAREDAMLVLSLLVPGDRLLTAIQIAERAGLACLQVSTRWRRDATRGAAAPTRHLH